MVNRLEDSFDFSEGGWNMKNIQNFTNWIDDNKSKTDEGCEAMKAVMSMGVDVASAAAIKWFRDAGKMKQEDVSEMATELASRIVDECAAARESVIKDCASLFAGTGNLGMVVMMAFVSYSLVGVRIAESVMSERS
jgi:hypothetical protein